MIIDSHVHVHPDRHGLGDRYDASSERLYSELESGGGPDKVILLPIYGFIDNDFVYDVSSRMPNRIVIFGSVDPKSDRAVSELEVLHGEKGIKGVKLHPRRQDFTPSGEDAVRTVRAAADLGLPVVFDCLPWGHGHANYNHPSHYDVLASKVPHAKIIIAHCAGHNVFEAFTVAKANPNVYLDISLSVIYYEGSSVVGDMAFCARRLGAGRIVYGSDFPQYGLAEYLDAAGSFLDAGGFTAADRELVMGGNIARLAGL